MANVLYTPHILALAVSLADWPLADDLPHQAELRSQSCGSVVRVGLRLDEAGRVAHFGVRAQACALGQASAAILADRAIGQGRDALITARDALTAFLAGDRTDPGDWPGIDHIASALPYPARHGSILLPWRAIVAALDQP
ncbi:iron-sulfur cluster scaffold-like protein [Blastomonas sp. AAP53]|uniref:iron-sulfur cluster assembly scaffold protein n=1 Tax=Blastomonas sp. AAP53 TaxID=1248760 RepID=UPI0002E3116B|nr:iron-sulfur cluster scaffold-like protein [Blastomonas sp. AAP53]